MGYNVLCDTRIKIMGTLRFPDVIKTGQCLFMSRYLRVANFTGVSLVSTKPDEDMHGDRTQCWRQVIFQLSAIIKGPETANGRGPTARKMDSTTIKTDGSIYTCESIGGNLFEYWFVMLKQLQRKTWRILAHYYIVTYEYIGPSSRSSFGFEKWLYFHHQKKWKMFI
jgi:hypothetical protein